MSEIEKALIEWRDARQAFFDVPPVPMSERFPPEIWTRLGHAEDDLMRLAKSILWAKK